MNAISKVLMYIYIFIPSTRGVNTLSAKAWYKKMQRNKKKDKAHSLPQKKRAYRAGYMPEHAEKFGIADSENRISERDYFYLQPLNGIYSKWLTTNEIAKTIYYPFEEMIDLDADTEGKKLLRLLIINDKGYYPEITEAYYYWKENGKTVNETVDRNSIEGWAHIEETIKKMARFTPQIEFFAVDLLDGKIVNFTNQPEYPQDFLYSDETVQFLKEKARERVAMAKDKGRRVRNAKQRIKWKSRQLFTTAFFPKDMMYYLGPRWIKEVVTDFFSDSDADFKTKMWAYRHGFLSYRINQYGITEENYPEHISDFEYKWLRHINSDYRILFADKITIKYIVNKFKECFPEYYYHIKTKNGENIIIPMMDCPEKYGNTYEDILALAKEKGVLAMKPEEGSHGNGFFKLSYEDGQFYLNFDKASEEEVLSILKDPDNQYLVTEYIKNNEQFKAIYPGAVNTIRMIVFKEDGVNPQIGNVYMRFGSKATGAVDNMGAGGIFVQVDRETGWYHDAKIITSNSIEPCPNHPDTGVLMEGYIPHYQQVKETILDVARSIPEMEYFGFDVAVTEDGIKFPEINRFPDYPRIEKLSPETMHYLLKKLDEKKRRCGYDKKPCRKLVHLPKR